MSPRPPFRFYPAIDLKDGACVRLSRGEMDSATVYGHTPLEQAQLFKQDGAEYLHVVDLDGACKGEGVNHEVIATLARHSGLKIQTGGGIRTRHDAAARFDLGVERVVFGTAALKAPEEVRAAAERFPGRVVVGVDVKSGMAATDGWVQASDCTPEAVLERFRDVPLAAVVFTVIERDGMLAGPDFDATLALAAKSPFPVILSGGVTTARDVYQAALSHPAGIGGVISGRALYEGKFTVADALTEVRRATALTNEAENA